MNQRWTKPPRPYDTLIDAEEFRDQPYRTLPIGPIMSEQPSRHCQQQAICPTGRSVPRYVEIEPVSAIVKHMKI